MEYIDVINIVNDAWLTTIKNAEHEMKKNLRKIELNTDKEKTIKDIIQSLPYENSFVGNAYINNGYTAGNTFVEIRENIANFYLTSEIIRSIKNGLKPNFIKEDVEKFFLLFRQEVKLWGMLNKPNTQYSAELIELFKGHRDLIASLIGKSDIEIARLINKWAKEIDKMGRSLIENPHNRLKKEYAVTLKKAGLIRMSVERFRSIL